MADLRRVLKDVLTKDMPPHAMRERLNDWDQESDEDRREMLAISRAIEKHQPIQSYVWSAQRLSELILRHM
jgi:hypothetical protein